MSLPSGRISMLMMHNAHQGSMESRTVIQNNHSITSSYKSVVQESIDLLSFSSCFLILFLVYGSLVR